jgi:hypothetical protein
MPAASPTAAPTFRSGTPGPLAIAASRPRAFSDAYRRALTEAAAASDLFDTKNFQFVGVDRSKIGPDGLAASEKGRWCFFFYSATRKREITVLLTYPATGSEPEPLVAASTGSPGPDLQIDPGAITVDSDVAIGKRAGLKLAADDNVRIQMDPGPDGKPRPAYLFVAESGIGYAVDARTGSAP